MTLDKNLPLKAPAPSLKKRGGVGWVEIGKFEFKITPRTPFSSQEKGGRGMSWTP